MAVRVMIDLPAQKKRLQQQLQLQPDGPAA